MTAALLSAQAPAAAVAPATSFQTYACFTSVDLAQNRQRFYTLQWQATLWGGGALVKTWGRLGTQGRSRTVFWGERQAAQPLIDRLLRRRVQHGYQLIAADTEAR